MWMAGAESSSYRPAARADCKARFRSASDSTPPSAVAAVEEDDQAALLPAPPARTKGVDEFGAHD